MRFGAVVSLLAAMFAGTFVAQVKAVQPSPEPACVGMTCSVTFTNPGDYYAWPVPTGVDRVSFELYGAQGGKGGGLGGKVTGTVTAVPAFLYVLVGGAGAQGNGVAGGYNGGGQAGVGHNDEGSGGGATDIRGALDLGSRLAVAGGGGGTGGWSGGPGGAGGGIVGNNGSAGQGGAGLGGSQTSGGAAGSPNGGSIGAAGSLGQGGAGGSSYSAGGGGGGGGYFGGGGGGPDVDDCCSDGGGAGGGSSWASPTSTTGMATQASVRSGSGLAILRYTIPPVVTSFAPAVAESNGSTANFNLAFNQSVTGLEVSDFNLLGTATGCSISGISGSGSTYQVAVRGCGHGSVQLQLKALTVTGEIAGPTALTASTAATLDQIAPTISLSRPSEFASQSTVSFQITSTESLVGLTADDLTVEPTTCRKGVLTGTGTSWQLAVSACPQSAQVRVTLAPNAVADSLGNQAPPAAIISSAVTIDYLAATVSSFTRQADQPGLTYKLIFDEPVNLLSAEDLELSGDGCQLGTITPDPTALVGQFASRYFVSVVTCANSANVLVTLKNHSVVNHASLESPILAASSEPVVFVIPAPTPPPAPTPTVAPTPTAAASAAPTPTVAPTPTAEPTQSPVTSSIRTEAPPQAPPQTPPQAPTPTVEAPRSEPVVSMPAELQPVASILLEPIEDIQQVFEPILVDVQEAVASILAPSKEFRNSSQPVAPQTLPTKIQRNEPARVIPLVIEPDNKPVWQPEILWSGAMATGLALLAIGMAKLVRRRQKPGPKIQRLRLVS